MGKSYSQQGEAQARAVLLDLAASPATARHVATELARHFAGDDPPKPMVDRLTNAYLKSGGDLGTLDRALIDLPEALGGRSAEIQDAVEMVGFRPARRR